MHLLAFAESIQLFPDGTIFIHIALVLVMIWVLNRTFFKPINRVLASREKHKGGEGGEAAVIMRTVSEKEAVYKKEVLDTRSKGYELIEKEQTSAAAKRDAKLGEVKSEVAGIIESGKADIARQTAEARAEIGSEAEKIADSIAASILKA